MLAAPPPRTTWPGGHAELGDPEHGAYAELLIQQQRRVVGRSMLVIIWRLLSDPTLNTSTSTVRYDEDVHVAHRNRALAHAA